VVQNHLETFLARWGESGQEGRVSAQAERELRRYLESGILAHGFARARCDACGHDFLIAFSCKGRAVCPSCNTRRMAETAAHLADHVMPRVPVRQWVLSVPKRLRYHLQHDREALNSALRILLDAIEQHLRGNLGAGTPARTGAVAFIHRFGSALNEHTHFHVVVIDGVFELDPEQGVRFIAAEAIDPDAVRAVQTQVSRRILRAFVRRGRIDAQTRKEMEAWDHGGGLFVPSLGLTPVPGGLRENPLPADFSRWMPACASRRTIARASNVYCATAPVRPSRPTGWRYSTRSG
jgi:uncharacterized Zn finger protein (UPF0148 family)